MSDSGLDLSEQNPEVVLNTALTLLDEGDFQQRWDAAKILSNLGNLAVEPLLHILQDEEDDLEKRWFVARILGEFDAEKVMEPLVNLLNRAKTEATEEDISLQEMAAATLAGLGGSAIAPLSRLLEQENSRLFATNALAQVRDAATIPPLLTVVNDPDPQVRAVAIEALGSFHDPRVPPVLLQALTDPVAAVRKEAVIGLGVRPDLVNDYNLVEQLKPLLWDIRAEVCQQTQFALGRFKTDEAATALFEQLQSDSVPNPLKIDAIRALGWISIPSALTDLQQFIWQLNPKVNPNLPLSSNSDDLILCQEVIQVLGRVESSHLQEQATTILIDLMNQNHPALVHPTIKQLIALNLGKIGGTSALDPLIQLLEDPNPSVRLHCISALKQLPPQKTHERLQTLLDQDSLNPALKEGISMALLELRIKN